jgi:Protein of unknown function (DUF3788)
MEYSNAFVGRLDQPSESEVAAALGPVAQHWTDLIAWMAEKQGVVGQEWKGIVVRKYGWSLRLQQKRRNIIHMSPGKGCFMVGFVLSDRALQAAKEADLPKSVQEALDTAPHYPEGYGVRLLVRRASDLSAIQKIAAIKIAN